MISKYDIERMLDNAASCSQCRHLLEDTTRECVILNLVKPLIEACSTIARTSKFVDGPKGTIEGQIAREILYLAENL